MDTLKEFFLPNLSPKKPNKIPPAGRATYPIIKIKYVLNIDKKALSFGKN